jgi:hypothetical protein
LKELIAALKNVHEWPESERQDLSEFLDNKIKKECLAEDSCNSASGEKTEYSEDDDNEHYDRV